MEFRLKSVGSGERSRRLLEGTEEVRTKGQMTKVVCSLNLFAQEMKTHRF